MKGRNIASSLCTLAVTLVVTAPSSLGHKTQPPQEPTSNHLPSPGTRASDFEMPGVDGQLLKLSSLRGKFILLEFTATWCPPCRQAARDIKRLRKELKASDLQVISVSLDGGENTDTTREDVLRFVREEQIDWPMLFDDTGMENAAARAYGVEVLPAYVLIDREGIIRQSGQGTAAIKQIQRRLRMVVNERPSNRKLAGHAQKSIGRGCARVLAGRSASIIRHLTGDAREDLGAPLPIHGLTRGIEV